MQSLENIVVEHLQTLRPYLQEDEGDIEFVKYEDETSVLEVRFLGNCKTCPLSVMTLRAGIERYLLSRIPEIRRVESVQ
ncbi:MAG: NifU family protein [Bacteroidetes bacterium]|nr:NifU family protein [Bacteroidota bacterium]